MDFKDFQIIRGQEGTQVRPKNLFKKFDVSNIALTTIPETSPKWQHFETFANQHTYTVANPQDIPEGVTEVRREDVSEPKWQFNLYMINYENEWIDTNHPERYRNTRQVAYYYPKRGIKTPEDTVVLPNIVRDGSGRMISPSQEEFDKYYKAPKQEGEEVPTKDAPATDDFDYSDFTMPLIPKKTFTAKLTNINQQQQEKPEEETAIQLIQKAISILNKEYRPKVTGLGRVVGLLNSAIITLEESKK